MSGMELYLNGEIRQVDDGLSVAALVDALGLSQQRLAVEVNRSIVPKSRHAEHRLQAGDRVEIIQAMGGG
ncbi:sulfur carrier protein ThiS [Arenimonas maotaiensis]|uniref:Sulfur carrier protein ThiS n=2 Tax=Arenimonas maotaiensis TaxID=1446479 RepID=A0A917FL75_9GAMM|nr:sulfur carrier protein ThiS [Arenimonas maotaiensis]